MQYFLIRLFQNPFRSIISNEHFKIPDIKEYWGFISHRCSLCPSRVLVVMGKLQLILQSFLVMYC